MTYGRGSRTCTIHQVSSGKLAVTLMATAHYNFDEDDYRTASLQAVSRSPATVLSVLCDDHGMVRHVLSLYPTNTPISLIIMVVEARNRMRHTCPSKVLLVFVAQS